jgi:hypothetical protein
VSLPDRNGLELLSCRKGEGFGQTLVASELGLDPKKVVDVNSHTTAAAVQ